MRTAVTSASLLALAGSAAAVKGFNYGSTFTTGAAKAQSDFENEFKTAAGLEGTSGFTSARLYTMIQAGTASDPISAIPAAINTGTSLLLGLWASGGDTVFANELLALKAAIAQHGDALAGKVDGISVGSEDLYRNSPTGIAAGSLPGTNPDVITGYIQQVRDAIAGTALSGAKIGHVDTWTAWVNGSNSAVIEACDWIGQDAYPYFESTLPNDISNSANLFNNALSATKGAVGSKPVWITETGWPVSGKTVGAGVPSLENAETFWQAVGCPLFDNTAENVWWYTLQDAAPDTPDPSFGVVGSTLSTTPLYNLTCSGNGNVSPSSSSSSLAAASSTVSSADSSASSAANSSNGSSSSPTGGNSSGGTIFPSSTSGSGSGGQGGSSSLPAATGNASLGDSGGSPQGIPSSQLVLESSATVTPSVIYASSNQTLTPAQSIGGNGGNGGNPPMPTTTTGAAGGQGGSGGTTTSAAGGSGGSNVPTPSSSIPTVNEGSSVTGSASFVALVGVFFAALLM